MCGIAGIGNKEDELDVSAAVEDSLERMRHRGPDDKGAEQWNRCCLGMCRLSIIDIESGHQPIWNEDRSMAIVLNGEVYNYLELRQELVVKGHKFYTKTDTEVLLHLYEEYGERMLEKLRGMFAFSIWDEKNQELFWRETEWVKSLSIISLLPTEQWHLLQSLRPSKFLQKGCLFH